MSDPLTHLPLAVLRGGIVALLDSFLRMPEDIQSIMEMIMSLEEVTAQLNAKVASLQDAVVVSNGKADLLIASHAELRARLEQALQDPARHEAAIRETITRIDQTMAEVQDQSAQNQQALDLPGSTPTPPPPAEPPAPEPQPVA